MKHWHIDDVDWSRFDPTKVDPSIVPIVKAAALVERNGGDYAIYLGNVFPDDPDFCAAADHWAIDEIQHGDALGRWATLADPSWDFDDAFARFRAGYRIKLDADSSIRGSRTGELIARCIVETGTSSYYTALADGTQEPVLLAICRLIAADEFRHFKLFYDHMKRYLARENISVMRRVRIALGRINEAEDDELAYAYYCSNEPAAWDYNHTRCFAAYMGRASQAYQYKHIERSTGMVLKAVGLPPRGRLSAGFSRLAWRLLRRRHDKYVALERANQPPLQRAA